MATGFPVKANYATGDVLTAANMNDLSGTVNYLQYMPPRNAVLNSNFSVWQRGTSIAVAASTSNAYTADRWAVATGANEASTVSRQSTGDTTNLPNIQYCGRFQRNSGQTGTSTIYVSNAFETINSIPFVGKTVTLSFYARAGANFSSASSVLTSKLYSGTGTDQQSNTGYTGAATVASANNTLTTTWQRFSVSGTVGTTANELSIEFSFTPVGTAGTNDYFEITGVQLELGSVANTYMPNQPTYQGELAACQRYYEKSYDQGTALQSNTTSGLIQASDQAISTTGTQGFLIPFKVTKRTTPTITLYRKDGSLTNPNYWYYSSSNGTTTYAAFVTTASSQSGFQVYTTSASGLTAGNASAIGGHYTADAEL